MSCYNRELRADIPLLLRFTSARRHDSVNFLVAFHELEKHMPTVSITNISLDSAMDNYPTYRLLKNRGILAFIDLNDRYGRPKTIPNTITIYKQRTATERINNRILNDYSLHHMFIHTKGHYSFMTTMIGICIHLDARYKQQMQTAA